MASHLDISVGTAWKMVHVNKKVIGKYYNMLNNMKHIALKIARNTY